MLVKNVKEIAEIYGVQAEDVAVRVEFSTHLCINQTSLCGKINNNKYPELAGIKMTTHSENFGDFGVICKSCNKNLEKKMSNKLDAKAKREWNSNQCEKCAQPLRDCLCEMATVEEVLKATQATAPEGWIVSHEYPNHIGVTHPSLTEDEFISFGDVNYDFGFNDCLNVCGDMKDLTDADEIAESFWQQIAEIYPNLVKGE